MKLFVAAPANLLDTSHLEKAIVQADIVAEELLLPSYSKGGSTSLWLRDWAKTKSISVHEFSELSQAVKILKKSRQRTIIAVLSPEHPETLDFVSEAEALRIPVYIYRELYRQDPRLNCRFSPVERPDTWLRALTAEQRDFFRRLHSLCAQYDVQVTNSKSGDASGFFQFSDGTAFEEVELTKDGCKVRPRGSFRYRTIPVD